MFGFNRRGRYQKADGSSAPAAVTDLKKTYPGLPVGGRDGAMDEYSSYLHVVVCYVEWQKMTTLVGADSARKLMEYLATDHYRAIYRFVLDHESELAEVVKRHELMPAAN